MLRPDMSELTSSKRNGNLGRTLLWVAIVSAWMLWDARRPSVAATSSQSPS